MIPEKTRPLRYSWPAKSRTLDRPEDSWLYNNILLMALRVEHVIIIYPTIDYVAVQITFDLFFSVRDRTPNH